MIAVQRAEHIDLQTKIETSQRNFRETCRGPEKDFYPKSQNAKVEDPQSSQSIKPELTSVHPYCSTNKSKWIFKGNQMKTLNTYQNWSYSTKLTLEQGLREFQWIIQELMVKCCDWKEGRANRLLMPYLRDCQTKPTQWRTHIWTGKVLPPHTRNHIRFNKGSSNQARKHQKDHSNYIEPPQTSINHRETQCTIRLISRFTKQNKPANITLILTKRN